MKNKNGLNKHSLRIKMTIALIIAMMAAILSCWLCNKTLMEDYFMWSERKQISKAYKDINAEIEESGSIDTLMLEQLSTKNNLKIMIAKPVQEITGFGIKTVYSSAGKDGKLYDAMYQILVQLQDSQIWGSRSSVKSEIKKNGYVISEHSNTKLDSTSINLVGVLKGGYLLVIDSSIESLQTAADIATRFLAYVGIVITLLASIAVYFYSKRFVRPIEEMSDIAQRMSSLDFNAKIVNLPKDEIGTLGKSMNQMAEQLEETISELKSANIELKKDIDRKIQLDEMRQEFLSHVSHELKTPIALIQGYAEGLVDNVNEDAESREFYCDVIIDEARKMNVMVQKLMTLNQIEFGQNQVEMQRFDIVELLSNIVESNEIRFLKKQASIRFEPSEPVYVWGDEFMIEDVVNNYVSNACNHIVPEGTATVWVEPKEDVARIWVYNDGNQIPEEDLEKVWIKFYKVDKARTREYGGSGVGLSIVAAIMEAHGRAYGVENREHGVAFYFELERQKNG